MFIYITFTLSRKFFVVIMLSHWVVILFLARMYISSIFINSFAFFRLVVVKAVTERAKTMIIENITYSISHLFIWNLSESNGWCFNIFSCWQKLWMLFTLISKGTLWIYQIQHYRVAQLDEWSHILLFFLAGADDEMMVIFLTIRLPSFWQTKLHNITAHHGMEVGCQLQQFPLIMKDEIVPVMYMEPLLTCNLAISANNLCSWLWQPIVCSFLLILICCQVFPNGLWFILVHHEILCLATRIGKFLVWTLGTVWSIVFPFLLSDSFPRLYDAVVSNTNIIIQTV